MPAIPVNKVVNETRIIGKGGGLRRPPPPLRGMASLARVARFFSMKHTKMGKHIPYDHKM
jgi:hypothetical protein